MLIVTGLLTSTAAAAIAAPSWPERWQSARFRSLERPVDEFSAREVQLTVRSAARIFGIRSSTGRAFCIAERESGWNEYAFNSSSAASGIFQHLRSYWSGRVAAYRSTARSSLTIRSGASPFNARANVLVSVRMMAQGQWYHWSSTDSPC